jgi:hypothetical protein
MDRMPGLLAVVRLRKEKTLYVVVAEYPHELKVDLISITGPEHRMRGVPLIAVVEVVEGPPRALE